ncbi:hypothetical protein SAMN04488054_1256 [Salibacterium qingdaonense]|uniref:Uncharacterized protein n=1 Tax=Salibacterium qingdaonense TaxID=266892 RepID=A0A1I4PD37_9BACI|nr:hypothetical protein SAMN04488054_1256 [Salibacterium qingdaonense]
MRRVYGEEGCAFTRGGLIGTPYTCGNQFHEELLNDQKSASAIVPCGPRTYGKGRIMKRELFSLRTSSSRTQNISAF